MTYPKQLKYPDIPHISYNSHGKTEIAYNGISLHFRTSAKGNPIFERAYKIDITLEGRIITETLGKTPEEIADSRKERNLNIINDREDLLDMIEELADWYDENTFKVLEDLLYNKLNKIQAHTPKTTTYLTNSEARYQQIRNKNREMFRNVWAIVFRDNCTPSEAARKLGYNPEDYKD